MVLDLPPTENNIFLKNKHIFEERWRKYARANRQLRRETKTSDPFFSE